MDAKTLFQRVRLEGTVVVTGYKAVQELRELLRQIREDAGIEFVFDPDSDPDIGDYLLAYALGAVEAGVVSSMIGAMIGSLFRATAPFALAGALIGGIAGGLTGVWAVDRGSRVKWRIFAWFEEGVPKAAIRRE